MKEYIVYSMDGVVTDRVRFLKLEEALVYANTMRQAGWHSVLWRKRENTAGDVVSEPVEVEMVKNGQRI